MFTTVEKELSLRSSSIGSLVSVGVFDGLHTGHQTLINKLVKQACTQALESTVITFEQHPSALLTPTAIVPLISSLEERVRLLKDLSVDKVIVLHFSRELAAMGAESFILLLKQHLQMKGMILGWDFALGHAREGSIETLTALGNKLGFASEVVGPVKVNNEIVSSTSIRNALMEGNISKANSMLGRPFRIEGIVSNGDERGRTLGFPTANLSHSPQQALVPDGVYACEAIIAENTYSATVFVGTRPTFNGNTRIVEAHIMDFNQNLYNQNIKLDMIERLRDSIQFTDATTLAEQIPKDIERTRIILQSRNLNERDRNEHC